MKNVIKKRIFSTLILLVMAAVPVFAFWGKDVLFPYPKRIDLIRWDEIYQKGMIPDSKNFTGHFLDGKVYIFSYKTPKRLEPKAAFELLLGKNPDYVALDTYLTGESTVFSMHHKDSTPGFGIEDMGAYRGWCFIYHPPTKSMTAMFADLEEGMDNSGYYSGMEERQAQIHADAISAE